MSKNNRNRNRQLGSKSIIQTGLPEATPVPKAPEHPKENDEVNITPVEDTVVIPTLEEPIANVPQDVADLAAINVTEKIHSEILKEAMKETEKEIQDSLSDVVADLTEVEDDASEISEESDDASYASFMKDKVQVSIEESDKTDAFNSTQGTHDLVETLVEFTATKYESTQINAVARKLLDRHKILANSLNFNSRITSADSKETPEEYKVIPEELGEKVYTISIAHVPELMHQRIEKFMNATHLQCAWVHEKDGSDSCCLGIFEEKDEAARIRKVSLAYGLRNAEVAEVSPKIFY